MGASGAVDPAIDFLAGWLAGVASVFVGHPLDTIKTRVQAVSTASHYQAGGEPLLGGVGGDEAEEGRERARGGQRGRGKGKGKVKGPSAWRVVQVMMREEGVRGFYRGVTSPLLGVAFVNACIFATYSSALSFLSPSPTSLTSASSIQHVTPLSSVFWAGTASGIATAFITTPLDRVKTLQQTYPSYTRDGAPLGTGRVVREVVKAQGWKGLFRGLGTTMIRDTGYGPYFFTYDLTLRALTPSSPSSPPDSPPHSSGSRPRSNDPFPLPASFHPTSSVAASGSSFLSSTSPELKPTPPEPPWTAPLVAGALAGVIGWLVTFPLDVVKTRLMAADVDALTGGGLGSATEKVSFWGTVREAWREEGASVFFRGLGPTLVRAVPVNAAMFFVYEGVVAVFR